MQRPLWTMAVPHTAQHTRPPELGFAALVGQWPDVALAALDRMRDPDEIQEWLNAIMQPDWQQLRSPLSVLRDRRCNPIDAGLFGAAALRRLGHRPRVLPVRRGGDVWLAAVYRRSGYLGALGWHPDPRLRFRRVAPARLSALGRSLSVDAVQAHWPSRAVDLRRYDGLDWMTEDAAAAAVAEKALAALADAAAEL